MSNTEELQFGNWKIGGTEFVLSGILHADYSKNIFELDFYSDTPDALPYYTDVVYGNTYQGKAFTLYQCNINGARSTSIVHGYKTKYLYKVNCSYILEGAMFNSENDILIKEVYFSVTNLNKWAFQEAIEMDLDTSMEYMITTKEIVPIIHKNEKFEFSISYATMPDYNYRFSSMLKISTNVRLTIKFEEPTSLISAHKIVYQIRDFFSLCTTLPTYIEYISGLPYYSRPQEIDLPVKIYGQAIETLLFDLARNSGVN